MPNRKQLTTNEGMPVGDNQNSMTVGPRGPMLMQDYQFVEKMAHFNRERIPERVVHAKGAGAYGKLTITGDISKYTRAKCLQPGAVTESICRFSTVAGEKGAADTDRDPRGFAIKFYTEEGNWDMVGNNTPIFFVRDSSKFSDFIHSQKRDPRTNLRLPKYMWDFWSLSPESLHQVTILFSDRGTPYSFRHMNGYGSHTFSFFNDKNERVWCKFHFKTKQGIKNFTREEAGEMAGKDPDWATRDLFEAIERGDFPKWKFCVQIMTDEQANDFKFNPFDLTKVWPHGDFPLIEVGEWELNRNPENYFAEIEQVAFSPVNVVPGISWSPDKMLQGRLLSYPDAHRYRLGSNYQQIPVNRPKCAVNTYNRDGLMRVDGNSGPEVNYEPNSFNGPVDDEKYTEPMVAAEGDIGRWNHREGNDDYSQAGDLFRLLKPDAQQRLIGNIVDHMGSVPKEIQKRQIGHFYKADERYGEGVAKGLGVAIKEAVGV